VIATAQASGKPRKPKKYVLVVGIMLLPFMPIIAAISFPATLIAFHFGRRRERRFARQLTALGRSLPIHDAISRIQDGNGWLLREWRSRHKGPVRTWWTAEAPITIRRGTVDDDRRGSFQDWCAARYTDKETGSALPLIGTDTELRAVRVLCRKGSSAPIRVVEFVSPRRRK